MGTDRQDGVENTMDVVLTEADLLDEVAPVEAPAQEAEEVQPEQEEAAEPTDVEETEEEVPDEVQPAKQPEKTVPVAAVIARERENRRLRQELARYQAKEQLGAEPQAPPEPAEPSPLEQWEKANTDAIRDDPNISPPYAVMKADREWQNRQTQAQQQVAAVQSARHTIAVSLNEARLSYGEARTGKGLDFNTVTELGTTLLTDEDKQDIRAVPTRSGEKMYRLCLQRLRESGSEEIKAALVARKTQPKPPVGGNSATITKPIKQGNPPTRQQALRRDQVRPHQRFGLQYG
jgi:hypothetical protein